MHGLVTYSKNNNDPKTGLTSSKICENVVFTDSYFFPCEDRIVEFFLLRENKSHRKPEFKYILRNVSDTRFAMN